MNRTSRTQQLCTMAILIAIEIVLTRFCSINTSVVRIGFGFLPVAMMGIMYGPLAAGIGYAIGDVIGATLFPSGPFFPGFTLSASLTGLVYGLILHRKDVTYGRALIASLIVVLCLDLCLTTYWLKVLYGYGFMAVLPTRIVKVIFAVPVQTILIPLVYNKVIHPIRNKLAF